MSFPPFSEGPTVVRRITTANSNSIDTIEGDPYRQGVELSLPEHYTRGIAKIHAGEPGHQLKQNNAGEFPDAIYPNNTFFSETDVFDPVVFVRRDINFDTLSPILAFKAFSTTEVTIMDGVIEPLTIRDEVQFSSIDVPLIPHSTKGNLEGANFNPRVNADRVVTVQKFSEKRGRFFGYEDNVDTFNGFPVSLGFFPNDERIVLAFDDTQQGFGRYVTGSFSSDLRTAVLKMKPDSENYVPFGFVAETAGFDDD
jgi:hypothetical protein